MGNCLKIDGNELNEWILNICNCNYAKEVANPIRQLANICDNFNGKLADNRIDLFSSFVWDRGRLWIKLFV